MNIRKIFERIYVAYTAARYTGHTKLIKEIADKNDVWVLVGEARLKPEFGRKALLPEEIEAIRGHIPKPILVDNSAVFLLVDMAMQESDRVRERLKRKSDFIEKIKDIIADDSESMSLLLRVEFNEFERKEHIFNISNPL